MGVFSHHDQGAGKIVHRLRVNLRRMVIHIDRDGMHAGLAIQGERNAGGTVQGGEPTGERGCTQFAVCRRGVDRFHQHTVRHGYGDQQVIDKSVTDNQKQLDNLVGADGQKLGAANKLFEDRLVRLCDQLRTALERTWETVAARISQGVASKSSEMDHQRA